MIDVDSDYEKKSEADEQELRQYDERAEGEGDSQPDNPRYRLAPSYFADYLANRPGKRAGQSLERAFRMWSGVDGVSGDVRAAAAQIQDDEEFEEDVWTTVGSSITWAFERDDLRTDGLDLVDELAGRAGSPRGKATLLVESGKLWYYEGEVEKARRNLNEVLGIDTSDCSWYIEFQAKGFLFEIDNLNLGQQAPHFSAQDIDGRTIDLADYLGRVVLLDFWATWCGPCVREFPHLRELATRYPTDKFAIIGIALDEDLEEVRKSMEAESLTWPQILDGRGEQATLATLFNIGWIPNSYILDTEGRIIAKTKTGEQIPEFVDSALNAVS